MSQPVLVLLTNHFPFGKGEAFIEPEIELLEKKFSKILIITVSTETELTRNCSHQTLFMPIHAGLKDYFSAIAVLFSAAFTIIDLIRKERKSHEIKIWRSTSGRIFIHDLFKALTYASRIRNFLEPFEKEEKILYSYWLNNRSLAAVIAAKMMGNTRVIARVHGGDLYTERHQENYLPFRPFLASSLQALCFISEHGRVYFNERYKLKNQTNQFISRLGTTDFGLNPDSHNGDEVTLVSCSFMEPVKRLDFMIQVIASITKLNVHWIHLGGGSLEKEIRRLAEQFISSNSGRRFTLKGTLSPQEIRNFYLQHPIHVFLNTSSSEGIPVAMMEAASAGIPLIATAVGGIPEIVSEENGILLPRGATAESFSEAIQRLVSSPDYKSFRIGARNVWERSFNAEVNFSNFADILLKLHNETGSGNSGISQR